MSQVMSHTGDDRHRHKSVRAHKWVWARKSGESLWPTTPLPSPQHGKAEASEMSGTFCRLNFSDFSSGATRYDLNFLIFHQGPRDVWIQKSRVNKMYHIFYSTVIFRTAGSGGALWVQTDSPDFRAHTHLWARTDLFLSRSSPLCQCWKPEYLYTAIHPYPICWCHKSMPAYTFHNGTLRTARESCEEKKRLMWYRNESYPLCVMPKISLRP